MRSTKRGAVRSIVFDLDGTLIDSLPGIEASMRSAVKTCLGRRELPELRSAVGPPVRCMLQRLFPDLSVEMLDNLVACFRKHYDAEGCLRSRSFAKVDHTLRLLREKRIELFVLTNKPSQPTQRILQAVGISRHFRAVISPDSSTPPFTSKTESARKLQSDYQLAEGETLLVGDGIDDARAAAACGFAFVAVAYGYGNLAQAADPKPVATLKSFSEIVGVVL